MKILILTRMYTHLIPAILSGKWQPKGMPALYKLIEGLNNENIQTDVLFLMRNEDNRFSKQRRIKFDELSNVSFFILPIKKNIFHWLYKRAILDADLCHLPFVLNHAIKNKYDIIYGDRIHVEYLGLLAYLKQKVVLRLYGVADLPGNVKLFRKKIVPSLQYLGFKAPFSYVICSKDGSPGKQFVNQNIRSSVPAEILLNGVDTISIENFNKFDLRKKFNLGNEVKILLNVGRISHDKNPVAFVQSLLELRERNPNFFSIMVGDGELRHEIELFIKTNNLENHVVLTGRISHDLVYDYLSQSDILVSISRYANLNNAVLEAMKLGKCIVTLKKCEVTQRDEQNDEGELKQALVQIDREKVLEELPNVLNELITNSEEFEVKGKLVQKYADKYLKTWDERIDYEMQILSNIVKN